MKKVKISIRICGKTATANLLYVDKSGKTHRSVKQVEKGPGDTRGGSGDKSPAGRPSGPAGAGRAGTVRPGTYRIGGKEWLAGPLGGIRR